ncbi:MAG: ankyrin repeat domain-containing protein [Enhygromyxa sp.]
MTEELEFRRRLAELQRRFLRPARAELDELAAALDYRGDQPGAALWTRAIAARRIPSAWADDPGRRFRATRAELARFAPELQPLAEPFADQGGRARHLLATPPSARAALLFASDPEGLAEAERLGLEAAAGFEAWGAPKIARVAWRLAGNPIDRVDASGPPLGALSPVILRLRATLAVPALLDEPPAEHLRFRIIVDALRWTRRRELMLDTPIPPRVRTAAGELAMPSAVVGRRFAELPDPLGPWLELSLIGYSLWAITDSAAGAVLELAAPFPPPRRLAPAREPVHVTRQRRAERDFPRAVWSTQLSALRLACARDDPGALRRKLPLLARDDEPGQPRLIHFAVYGGPAVLSVLAEHGHAPLEVRDAEGRTSLMLAAALPRRGPAGAAKHEIDVPISDIVGASSCTWLIAAGADTEARERRGQTALHLAAPNHRLHAVAALIQGGAVVDAVDELGRTPLMLALAAAAQPELVELLLTAGADPDLRDVHGWTALHYLAASAERGRDRRALARGLVKRGARPSRDLAGRSPAQLCAMQGVEHHDGGPLDLRTPVAAGPGAGVDASERASACFEPTLAAELVAERVPEPGHTPSQKPGTGEVWQVWADWLQSRGDPRGELVATSLARAKVGSRRGRALADELARLEQRCAAATMAGLRHADPLAPVRPSPIELERTHGFVTRARLSGPVWRRRSNLAGSARIAGAIVEAARALLRHEPLLAELRVGVDDLESWAIVIAGLRSLAPAPRLRRLVLERLPASLPELVELDSRFPNLRSLWLLGAGKINRGLVRWPGVAELRLRHGDTSEWTHGGVDLELWLPDLSHLDFSLPVGMRTVPAEIEGCAATLARLTRVRHLRLRPLAPEFAQAIFAGPTVDRLRTLELVGVRGQTLEILIRYAPKLRRLERLRIGVSPAVAEQRARELDDLRAELPDVEIR